MGIFSVGTPFQAHITNNNTIDVDQCMRLYCVGTLDGDENGSSATGFLASSRESFSPRVRNAKQSCFVACSSGKQRSLQRTWQERVQRSLAVKYSRSVLGTLVGKSRGACTRVPGARSAPPRRTVATAVQRHRRPARRHAVSWAPGTGFTVSKQTFLT